MTACPAWARRVFRWLAALTAGALLAACGTLPPPRERPAEHAAAPDPTGPLARIAAASTPPGEHSGFRLMP
ncbi:MAG TPA: phospholipase D family protein, partial [Burkholderiaceae bacterium]|nr:phospholipase D family protein [Burkholderiaceae bacterium]